MATHHEDAERQTFEQMANSRSEESGYDPDAPRDEDGHLIEDFENSPEHYLDHYGDQWHVVDCFPLDAWVLAKVKEYGLKPELGDDEFRCAKCNHVSDIENSIKRADGYLCEDCDQREESA
jgi:hypothetical protein